MLSHRKYVFWLKPFLPNQFCINCLFDSTVTFTLWARFINLGIRNRSIVIAYIIAIILNYETTYGVIIYTYSLDLWKMANKNNICGVLSELINLLIHIFHVVHYNWRYLVLIQCIFNNVSQKINGHIHIHFVINFPSKYLFYLNRI